MEDFMKNMGKTDKTIRTIVGAVLVVAGLILQLTTGQLWWLALPGAVLLLTSAASICPLYIPFGISTDKK